MIRASRLGSLVIGAALAGCAVQDTTAELAMIDRSPQPIIVSDNAGFGRALNDYRSAEGLTPLAWSPQLEAAARRHAADMAATGDLTHRGSDNSTSGARAQAEGYDWCRIAENIAFGYPDQQMVLEGWKTSPGHRRNLLLADVQDFGIAQVQQDYWVLVLGRDDDC